MTGHSAATTNGSGTLSINADAWRRRIREETFGLYHYEMGVAIRRDGNIPAAINAFRRALDILPRLSEAHDALIRALDDAGRNVEAEVARAQALSILPDYQGRAALRRARDLLSQNRPEALEALNEAEALAPALSEVKLRRGQTLECLGRREEAVAVLRNYQPENAILADETAAILLRAAHTLRDTGAVEQSIPAYERAFEVTAPTAQACADHGLALLMLGRAGRAATLGREAVKQDATLATGHIILGLALQAGGNPDGALACFLEADRLDPKDVRVPLHVGLVLQSMGRVGEAMDHYQAALNLIPTLATAVSCRGLGLQGQGLFQEAEACHRKALTLDSSSAWAFTDLGLALDAQGRHAEALDAHRQAITLQPQWIAYHARQRGWAAAALEAAYRKLGFPLPAVDLSP